ncbi:MAG TPA: MerR family transcriptional regulator [Kofleriaceae bacterium]
MTEQWTLAELVSEVGTRIAALPAPKNGQIRAVPDDRTVRYYATLGLLDRPDAMRGRTAIYGRKHLAQIVAIKRMQTMGRSLAEIQALWPTMDDQTLGRMAGVALPITVGRAPARQEFWKREPARVGSTTAEREVAVGEADVDAGSIFVEKGEAAAGVGRTYEDEAADFSAGSTPGFGAGSTIAESAAAAYVAGGSIIKERDSATVGAETGVGRDSLTTEGEAAGAGSPKPEAVVGHNPVVAERKAATNVGGRSIAERDPAADSATTGVVRGVGRDSLTTEGEAAGVGSPKPEAGVGRSPVVAERKAATDVGRKSIAERDPAAVGATTGVVRGSTIAEDEAEFGAGSTIAGREAGFAPEEMRNRHPQHAPIELRIELAPNVSLVLAVVDEHVSISPADVRAIRAAAAPLIAELAQRRLTTHAGGEP